MLKGKIALVTGGGRGIGRETALTLAGYGADVAVNYSGSRDAAQETAAEIEAMGRRALAIRADVTKEEECAAMFHEIAEKLGRIDILVNNAGITRDGLAVRMSVEAFDAESLEHAQKRGAKIYAEIGGYGATCDAFHMTSPEENGEGAARAMQLAMQEAGLTPGEVQYINAHGTGTHHNDLYETRAIKKAFGKDAYALNVNSTKSMTGHMLGAAGAAEFIVCVKSVMENYIHATAGFREAEAEMDLNYTKEPVEREVTAAISNSLGFGGHNGSLLVKKYTE